VSLRTAEYDRDIRELGYESNVRILSMSLLGRLGARYPGRETFLLGIQEIYDIFARSDVGNVGNQILKSKMFPQLSFEVNTSKSMLEHCLVSFSRFFQQFSYIFQVWEPANRQRGART
jgi:hypothetical protein